MSDPSTWATAQRSGAKPTPKQLAAVFALCRDIGLDDDERRELTAYVCATETGSLRELDSRQVGRVIDALTGFQSVRQLILQRPPRRVQR